MTYYARERIFWIVFVIMVLLRQDFWGWSRIKPLLFGWMPYIIWYDLLVTILVFFMWVWVARWVWPDPDLGEEEREGKR